MMNDSLICYKFQKYAGINIIFFELLGTINKVNMMDRKTYHTSSLLTNNKGLLSDIEKLDDTIKRVNKAFHHFIQQHEIFLCLLIIYLKQLLITGQGYRISILLCYQDSIRQ